MIATNDPTKLARRLYAAATELSRCLATDVRIEPVHVIVPLLKTMDRLQDIARELGRAAISVDEPAAQAANRAAEQLDAVHRELAEVVIRLDNTDRPPPPSPRGRSRRQRNSRLRPTESEDRRQ